jgi:type IV pilus assembly protein PilM
MDEPKQSIWKKEISLGRKSKQPQPEQAPKPDSPAEPKQSLWKKEISLKRKPKAEAPPPEPDAVAEAPPPAGAPATPEPADVPAVPPAQPELVDLEWLTAGLDALAAAETMTVPVADVPAAPPVAAPATAVPPPEPGIHPPVPAAELPPLPEEKPKSLLKKEISFKRKPKEPKQKAEKPSKPKRERKPKAERGANGPKPQKRRSAPAQARKLPKRIVGLKIGASQLAAARIVNNGHAQVEQVAREELEQGIVVAGELREPEALAIALRAFFKKYKLPKRNVRLGIANNRIGVRTFEITGIEDPKQLANAIRFRAQEALPISIEEAVLDYQILGESRDEEGQLTTRVLLVVAYRELIDRYVSACRKAGINLVAIDLEAFALLRSLAAPPEDATAEPQAALVAVSVGHERSTFAVSDGRVCEFTRVLDWGGGALNAAIARELGLTPGEAEPIKRALSLGPVPGEIPEGLTEEQAAKAREAVRRQVQTFARELVSSLQFYQNQPGSLGIGEIVVTGGTAHLDGLAEELQRLMGVDVRVGDPLARVSLSRRVKDPEQLGSLAVAIGLGIED